MGLPAYGTRVSLKCSSTVFDPETGSPAADRSLSERRYNKSLIINSLYEKVYSVRTSFA